MANTTNYAFLMIDYETPELINDLHKKIKDDELFVKDNEYGKEMETHVTLVPCLDNDVDVEKIKKMLLPIDKYKILLSNISTFDSNDEYDVLKCDAQCNFLHDTNKKITEVFPTHTEFKDYHPHVTIAYLKKGMAEKYKKDIISPLCVMKPKEFHISYYDNDGKLQNIKFKS